MAHTKKELSRRPPIILALENSGMCGSVAVISARQCIAEQSLQSRLTHSRRLLSAIHHLLDDAELHWPQIDALAISLGPGSFTGLRIGLSTVKGLAFATGIPLIGVSSLDGLASQFGFASLPVRPVFDARKKEVYTALYRPDERGMPNRVSDYEVVSPHNLIEQITEPTILVGDGTEIYGELFRDELGEKAVIAPPHLYFPKAASIAFLALSSWEKRDFLDPATAVPIYIRPSDAEIHFGRKSPSPAPSSV